VLDEREWSTSRFGRFNPCRKHQYPLNTRLSRRQNQLDVLDDKRICCSCWDSNHISSRRSAAITLLRQSSSVKSYRGVKELLHLCFTSVLEEGENSALRPGRTDPRRRAPTTHLGPQRRPGHDNGQTVVCLHLAQSPIPRFISPWFSHVYETRSLEAPLNKWGMILK